MEQYKNCKEEARKYLKSADHILFKTFPLLNDPKLLLKVMDNIFLSVANSMAALLYFEKKSGRINDFKDNFETKLDLFRRKCLLHHKIDPNYVKFILEVKKIIIEHRKSPIEFVRKDKFVICSNDYKMKAIGMEDMKSYLQKTKAFYGRIDNILTNSK